MKIFYDGISLMDTDYFDNRSFFKITLENLNYFSIYMESIDNIRYSYAMDNTHTLIHKQLGTTVKTTFHDGINKLFEASSDGYIFSNFDKLFINVILEQDNFSVFRNTTIKLDLLLLQQKFSYLNVNELSLKLANTIFKLFSYKSEKYGFKNHFKISTDIIKRLYIDDSEVNINQLEFDNLKDYILESRNIKIQISDQFLSHLLHEYSNFINNNIEKPYTSIQAIRLVNILQFNRFSQIKDNTAKMRINLMTVDEIRPLSYCRKLPAKKSAIESLLGEIEEKEPFKLINHYSYANKCFNIELTPVSQQEKYLFLASIYSL